MREKKRIDDDWKKRASEEKAKIASQLEGAPQPRGGAPATGESSPPGDPAVGADRPGGGSGAPTDPIFVRLVSTLGGQAMMALGLAEDPQTGERFLDLELARQSIDMLGALETKTRGNLSAEEDGLLGDVLHQLRMTYTQRLQQAQAAAARRSPPGDAAGGPGA